MTEPNVVEAEEKVHAEGLVDLRVVSQEVEEAIADARRILEAGPPTSSG